MSSRNVFHCPMPDRTCLRDLLRCLVGKCLTVTVPGDTVSGRLTAVGRDTFNVGGRGIGFETSFYFPLPVHKDRLRDYKATALIEELQPVTGRLSRIGKDYVVIRSEGKNGTGRYVVVPLNIFSQVTCEKDHEE